VSLVHLDGRQVTWEERDDFAACLRRRRTLLGCTLGVWTVLARVGNCTKWKLRPGSTNPLWLLRAACCGRIEIRSSSSLGSRCTYPDRLGRQCRQCTAEQRPREEACICRWCKRSTWAKMQLPKRSRGGVTATQCGACCRAATRNGRAADGRPIRRKC